MMWKHFKLGKMHRIQCVLNFNKKLTQFSNYHEKNTISARSFALNAIVH